MGVSLFTSRIVLQTLGVTDYGINNVVGGVVAMFGFISHTLMVITQRYITVELGKGNNLDALKKIFSTSMFLHIAVSIIVIIISETIGIWFINNKLVIPAERMIAANFVFQFALFGFLLSLINAPLMALIISHEDMHIYGYMGIFDMAARLATVYLLLIISSDKLIFYAFFGFSVSCIVFLFYFIYCRRKYKETNFSLSYDKTLLKELSRFGKYVFISSIFMIINTQGINILLNMFFGPAINAARGIANSVNNALMSFGNSFKQALNPQLMKSYAQNNPEYMWNLVERGTRILYFLFFIFSLPILLQTNFILKLWLGKVPEYTSIFTQLMVINALINVFLYSLSSINQATGNIKAYSIVGYIFSPLVLIFSYILCKLGYEPQYVFFIPLFLFPMSATILFIVMKRQVNFSILHFTKKALIPIFLVSIISFSPFHFLNKLFCESFWHSWIIIFTNVLWTGFIILLIGIKKNERLKLFILIKRKIGLAV